MLTPTNRKDRDSAVRDATRQVILSLERSSVPVADGQDLHGFVYDQIQDAIDGSTFAIKELANTLLAENGFGCQGTAIGEFRQALDGIT